MPTQHGEEQTTNEQARNSRGQPICSEDCPTPSYYDGSYWVFHKYIGGYYMDVMIGRGYCPGCGAFLEVNGTSGPSAEEKEGAIFVLEDIEGMENLRLKYIFKAIHDAGYELRGTGLTPGDGETERAKLVLRQDSESAEWLRKRWDEAARIGKPWVRKYYMDAYERVADKFGIDLDADDND